MKKKTEKLNFSSAYKDALGQLASRPEYKAFLRLMEIEEKNIVVMAFKINSSDPDLNRKKAHLEGRIFQMRKIKNTFDWALKGEEKEGVVEE